MDKKYNRKQNKDVEISKSLSYLLRHGAVKEGLNISTFESYSEKDPNYLSINDMYSIYNSSTINLSLSGGTVYAKNTSVLSDHIRGNKARPFEICAAMGFCMCEFSVSTSKWFKDKEEIIFFYSNTDLTEKINYYLSNVDEAKKIAMAGSKKVREEFSSQAVSRKFKELVTSSQSNIGFDLYGAPQKLKVSPWFAYSYIEVVFPISFKLLVLKGEFRIFLNDSRELLKFLQNLSLNIGIFSTLKVVIISFFRMIKTLLSKVKFS